MSEGKYYSQTLLLHAAVSRSLSHQNVTVRSLYRLSPFGYSRRKWSGTTWPLYDLASILAHQTINLQKAKLAMKVGGEYRLRISDRRIGRDSQLTCDWMRPGSWSVLEQWPPLLNEGELKSIDFSIRLDIVWVYSKIPVTFLTLEHDENPPKIRCGFWLRTMPKLCSRSPKRASRDRMGPHCQTV
jgi:hypothetical protein